MTTLIALALAALYLVALGFLVGTGWKLADRRMHA